MFEQKFVFSLVGFCSHAAVSFWSSFFSFFLDRVFFSIFFAIHSYFNLGLAFVLTMFPILASSFLFTCSFLTLVSCFFFLNFLI